MSRYDQDREVPFDELPFDDEDPPILPDQTRDDTDQGWGRRRRTNDDRLLADRPPHWE